MMVSLSGWRRLTRDGDMVIIKFYKKYKMLPVQIKASGWFLICAFLQKGISFITTPIFTRLLSTAEYGQYNVFTSWKNIIAVIISLNLYCGVYTRGLVKFEKDRKAFSSSLQGLNLTLLLLWLAIYLPFRDFWNHMFSLSTVQMLLMFQTIWTTSVFAFWSMEQRVDFRYFKLVIVTIVVTIAKPVVGIVFVTLLEDKVTARILGWALVEFLVYTWFFFGQIFRGKVFFSFKYWKHALMFNVPLIPHYLSQTVLNSADRIMIRGMVNESAAGIYSLAYSISLIMTMFNTALMQTIEPWMYKKINNQKISDISSVAYPVFMLIAFINVVLIAFAPEIVAIFAPAEYHAAIWIIPPVTMSVFFMFSYSFFAVFEFYYEKKKFIVISTCVGALLNIVLNFIFIRVYGYYAAGYTTLFCYIIYAILHFISMKYICKKYLDNNQPYSTKIYLTIAGTFLVISTVLLFSYHSMILRYMFIAIMIMMSFLKRRLLIENIKNIIFIRQNKLKDL